MVNMTQARTRYFLTYRGVSLPLKLCDELDEAGIQNRGTFFRATYDERGLITRCEKVVYGDIEIEHDYAYDADGKLVEARIASAGEDPHVVRF